MYQLMMLCSCYLCVYLLRQGFRHNGYRSVLCNPWVSFGIRLRVAEFGISVGSADEVSVRDLLPGEMPIHFRIS